MIRIFFKTQIRYTNLRKIGRWVPGARKLVHKIQERKMSPASKIVITRPSARENPPAAFSAIAARYRQSPTHTNADTFVLYRIIGNDLVPRHAKGQARTNLAFILENEPEFAACEKRFVLNRIADRAEEQALISMLEAYEKPYHRLPFEAAAYAETCWDIKGVPTEYAPYGRSFSQLETLRQQRILTRLYRFKNNAVIHNNAARNTALEDGRTRAKWVLPFDGNCFFTERAFEALRCDVAASADIPYHVVAMARMTDNTDLLDPAFSPAATDEPQIVFRSDSLERFDPAHPYGRRPKVELLWRLGVDGPWDEWPLEPWDLPVPPYSPEAGAFVRSGWVTRLFSGNPTLELQGAESVRGNARNNAIIQFLDALDDHTRTNPEPGDPGVEAARPGSSLSHSLHSAALQALKRGPFSVVDKTSLPPSGNPHDYWHAAPYYWPNPVPIPALPYVRRDGQRVPGTRLYEAASESFDRTRLQRMFDDTYVLTLAAHIHRKEQFASHAAANVRRWFLDPESAMNPSLDYAQVRRGHAHNRGAPAGIIEMKDLYYCLSAVSWLISESMLTDSEVQRFAAWLEAYRFWLETSSQGRSERASSNNHGTYFDLQYAAIARFLGDRRAVLHTVRDARFRIETQFDAYGAQPEELARTTTAHYCHFNLQGWVNLASIADSVGDDLWAFTGREGQSLAKAIEWLVAFFGEDWPYQQIDTFDSDRTAPLWHAYRARFGSPPSDHTTMPAPGMLKPIFFPHDGIMPFWQFGLDALGSICAWRDQAPRREDLQDARF